MVIFVNALNLLVNLWLLIIVHRQAVRKQLPWFVSYIAWEVLAGIEALILRPIDRQFHDALYWWKETIEIVLIVAAVRESFLRLFRGFTRKPGFRWSVWGVIGGVVIYSVWNAFRTTSVQQNKFGIFEVDAEFLFRWAILGIALLSTILGLLLGESPETREDAVILGFGVASAGFLFYVVMFSLFGTKYTFFTKFAPPVGYFVAAGWWIWVFSHPVARFGFKELGMGPEDIGRAFRRSREFVERLMREEE
jgi:hypothetical protein